MEKKDVKKTTELNFFIFDIETGNSKIQELKAELESMSFENAANIAGELRLSYDLSREEIILCYIAEAFAAIANNDIKAALISLGSAYGLAQSQMRMKIDLMIAVVNTLDGNEKETQRKLKEINGVLTLKEALSPTDSLKNLRLEISSVWEWFSNVKTTVVADNAHPIKRTNEFFKVSIPIQ